MKRSSKRSVGLAVAPLLWTLAGAAFAAGATEPPVVVALDASRSLSAAESRAAADWTKGLLGALPASATPGVLVFDDEVRWLARPGAPGAAAGLDALTPGGRYTVLNDGLIEGVRALGEGGVLVLVSDGKDENSATTLEDAARLASENGVRLVTLAAGRADERTLRRLALLTGGLHAGRADQALASAVGEQIAALRTRIAAERAATEARAPKVAAAPAPPSAEAVAEAAAALVARQPPAASGLGSSRWLLPIGAGLAALGVVLGFLLARRRAAAEIDEFREVERGTRPGVQWPESASPAAAPPTSTVTAPGSLFSTPPSALAEVDIARVRLRPAVRPQGLLEISLDETAEFRRLPFSESIERTLVLTAEVVLTVHEPGRDARSYRLPPDRAVDIGRDAAVNTLAFPDPTMSTQHLRVLLEEDRIFLVDLGSTNGVKVGERRVDAVELHPGDRFRAGMIEFELGLHHASAGRIESA